MARRERGQRAGLTREAILAAALEVADREGLKALSMRRLGTSLGVEAMALYHHVAGKEALLDGLVEHVFAQTPVLPSARQDWREWTRAYAVELLATLLAHPNVLPLVIARPAQTPRNDEAMEHALTALEASGFAPWRALNMVYALNGLVVGHAVVAAEAAPDQAPAPIDAAAYPRFAAAAASEHGGRDRFVFALESMLDGFEAAAAREGR